MINKLNKQVINENILILIIIKTFIKELNENIYDIRININYYKVEILY